MSKHTTSEKASAGQPNSAKMAQNCFLALQQIVSRHVIATGPVDFADVLAYVRQQFTGVADDYEVAAALNALIVAGSIELYDDGQTFTAGNQDTKNNAIYSDAIADPKEQP